MRKGWSKILFLLLLFMLLFQTLGMAQVDIPKPVGDIYVQDFANVLSPNEKQELIDLGRKLEDASKAQVAVLTVDTTNGAPIEEYATEAFRTYKLGDQKLNNGVLFVIALKDRKTRIEVGYGLEGAIPDGKAGRILDDFAMPNLQNNQPDLAVMGVYKALYNEVAKEYQLNPDQLVQNGPPNNAPSKKSFSFSDLIWALIIFALIIIDFIFFGGFFTFAILSLISRGGGGRFGGGGPRGGGGGSSGGGGASRGW
ncbi:TPM domain-containing protein [Tepidibacillus marianensis]|uniref:TPM domain-containing protein n=1 Tax=Tepidibacillus marianensis TaxID=3131995 RepID=UPI0030CF6A6F